AVRVNREGLVALLAGDPRLDVCALSPAADGVALQAAAADVVVIDASADCGPAAIRHVLANAQAPVVALGVSEDERDVIAFAELGVVGFVEREASLEDLVESICSAARAEASFPPRIATVLLKRVSSLAVRRTTPTVTALTMRERQVVQLIA